MKELKSGSYNAAFLKSLKGLDESSACFLSYGSLPLSKRLKYLKTSTWEKCSKNNSIFSTILFIRLHTKGKSRTKTSSPLTSSASRVPTARFFTVRKGLIEIIDNEQSLSLNNSHEMSLALLNNTIFWRSNFRLKIISCLAIKRYLLQ